MIKRKRTGKKIKKVQVKRKKTKRIPGKRGIKNVLKKMLNEKKYITAILAVFIVVSAVFAINLSGSKYSVIMVIDDKACHCVKRRCVTLDSQVSDLVKNKYKNKIKVTKLQFRDKNAKGVMDKYKMGMVPSVVLLDSLGNIKGNWNYYNFRIGEFEQIVDSILKGERND